MCQLAGRAGRIGGGNRLSEQSISGLAKSLDAFAQNLNAVAQNLDSLRGVVDRIEAWNAKMGPQMEMLSGSTAVMAGDRRRKRRWWTWAALAMAAMLALGAAGGAVLQSRVEVLPQADPTRGWKDHFWKYYGRAFQDCFDRAKESESGYTQCEVRVRGR